MSRRLFIITGDHSADQHAANVLRHLKIHEPDIEVSAVGGDSLKEAGAHIFEDQSQMGRVGFGAFVSAPYHYFLGHRIVKYLESFKPDAVLLIDYGGFNLKMAKALKERGHKVFYFIPPQVWASRKGRIKAIKKYVDHVFCIFPFEETLYRECDIPVTYVGHPLTGELPQPVERKEFCEKHGLDPEAKIVALFPGSRKMEINYLLQPMIESTVLIENKWPKNRLQFVVAQPNSLADDYFSGELDEALKPLNGNQPFIKVLKNQHHALQSVADVAIVKSGTATLETALYKTPMILLYKGHWFPAMIARKVMCLPCWGLPNILVDPEKPIIRELLQEDVTPQKIGDAVLPLFDPESIPYQKAMTGFEKIAEKMPLNGKNTTETVALELLKLL